MRPADGEELDTFTIVTTEANAAMRPLHDRMPVILAPGDYWAWLNGVTEADQIQALVRPVPGRRSRCIRWGSRSAT